VRGSFHEAGGLTPRLGHDDAFAPSSIPLRPPREIQGQRQINLAKISKLKEMKNFKLAVIYKKTPYGAKGSTKLHTKMTGKVSGGFR